MHNYDIGGLEKKFGLGGSISFREKQPGIAVARIGFGSSSADLSLYGGQVLSFRPSDGTETLFLSKQSFFEPGKAIRGGIPLCWPWFGPHPADPNQPLHGFLRFVHWDVESTDSCPNTTRISLVTVSDGNTVEYWPHKFKARLDVAVGERLELTLTVWNTGDEAWTSYGAFHPYFRVGDILRVKVDGLDGVAFSDRGPGGGNGVQTGSATISGLTDRFYDSGGPKTIVDPSLGRVIRIEQRGCPASVIWNPWVEKSRAMADLGDEEYRETLCVEPVRPMSAARTVLPGESDSIGFSFAAADTSQRM